MGWNVITNSWALLMTGQLDVWAGTRYHSSAAWSFQVQDSNDVNRTRWQRSYVSAWFPSVLLYSFTENAHHTLWVTVGADSVWRNTPAAHEERRTVKIKDLKSSWTEHVLMCTSHRPCPGSGSSTSDCGWPPWRPGLPGIRPGPGSSSEGRGWRPRPWWPRPPPHCSPCHRRTASRRLRSVPARKRAGQIEEVIITRFPLHLLPVPSESQDLINHFLCLCILI